MAEYIWDPGSYFPAATTQTTVEQLMFFYRTERLVSLFLETSLARKFPFSKYTRSMEGKSPQRPKDCCCCCV